VQEGNLGSRSGEKAKVPLLGGNFASERMAGINRTDRKTGICSERMAIMKRITYKPYYPTSFDAIINLLHTGVLDYRRIFGQLVQFSFIAVIDLTHKESYISVG